MNERTRRKPRAQKPERPRGVELSGARPGDLSVASVLGNAAVQRRLRPAIQAIASGTGHSVARQAVADAVKGDAGTDPAKPALPVKHYTLKSTSISLSDKVVLKVGEIADEYHAKTKKDIVVTDGSRSAADQARRMYDKLESGEDILKLYVNQTATKEVKEAYDSAVTAKKTVDGINEAMTKVIETQVKDGTYISDHLKDGAVDVRNNDMTDKEKEEFQAAVKAAGGASVISETKPAPHFHIEID